MKVKEKVYFGPLILSILITFSLHLMWLMKYLPPLLKEGPVFMQYTGWWLIIVGTALILIMFIDIVYEQLESFYSEQKNRIERENKE